MKEKPSPPPPRSLRPNRGELRASLLLPVAIILAIWVVGLLVYALRPGAFGAIVSLVIGASLLIFLLFRTRRSRPGARLTAVLLALPALAGITAGLITGQVRYTLAGIGLTLLLLLAQQFFNTPLSYHAAYRRFRAGDEEGALRLINKSVAARPDFWQSYQLRALISLGRLSFAQAERDARQALALRPDAHPVYNTLGQLYLAQNRFAEARDAYVEALRLAPELALYHYHLGLSHYRLGDWVAAAAALAAATQGTLPTIEYDLQAHYYLGRSLEAAGEGEAAQEAWRAMAAFAEGLAGLQAQLAGQPDYPHLSLRQADMADLAGRL